MIFSTQLTTVFFSEYKLSQNKKQISIRLNPDRIASLRINTGELYRQLQNANFSMTAGHFFDLDQKITVNPIGEYKDIQEIADLIVTPNVRLRDIATVEFETPKATEGRHLDRTHAIGLNIFRESDANLVDVSTAVMAEVEKAKNNSAFNGSRTDAVFQQPCPRMAGRASCRRS